MFENAWINTLALAGVVGAGSIAGFVYWIKNGMIKDKVVNRNHDVIVDLVNQCDTNRIHEIAKQNGWCSDTEFLAPKMSESFPVDYKTLGIIYGYLARHIAVNKEGVGRIVDELRGLTPTAAENFIHGVNTFEWSQELFLAIRPNLIVSVDELYHV